MPLSRARDYLSIGEVLAAIRPEFPDVSISKIRFLENEGLIAPERTESGYRKFYDTDVRRLRYILSLQRDHFLPLRVIRERLAGSDGDGDQLPEASAAPAPEEEEEERHPRAAEDVRLGRDELARAAGLSERQLAGLEEFGVLARREGAGAYGGDELEVARAARTLLGLGLEPRHLRAFRHSAEREVALVAQLVTPIARRRGEGAREAADAARQLVEAARRLRDGLIRRGLRDILP